MNKLLKAVFAFCLISYGVVALAAPKKEETPTAKLQQELSALVQTFPGKVGLYVHDLKTNETITVNADEPFLMASTYKIPIMIQLFRDHDAKKLSIHDQIALKKEQYLPYGLLSGFTPGSKLSLHDLALLMITVSDNTSTDIILDKVNPKRVNETLQSFKISPMSVDRTNAQLMVDLRNATATNDQKADKRDTATARAMGQLIEKLVRNEVASKTSCEDMKNILERTQNNGRIARKFWENKDISVAHKTGTSSLLTHDVGFIKIKERPEIIVCIYTMKNDKATPTFLAEELMGNISDKIVKTLG
jgi:beta-lactamase class A